MLEDIQVRKQVSKKDRQKSLDRWVFIWNVKGADANDEHFGDAIDL